MVGVVCVDVGADRPVGVEGMALTVVVFDPTRDKSYQGTALGSSVAEFLAWFEVGGAAGRTLDQYERDLSRACLMYPDVPLEGFGDEHMLHVAKQFKPAERRVRCAAYRKFFKWALGRRLITLNPCDALPDMRRQKQTVFDIFSRAEVESLCGLPSPDGGLFSIMFGTGARKGDCRNLQARDFHGDRDPAGFAFLDGKGGKDRFVEVGLHTAQAASELILLEGLAPKDFLWYGVRASDRHRKVIRSTRCGEGTFHRWYGRCLEDAGVRYRNPHMTRHTFATNWLRDGGRLETLQLVLGHESISTTSDLYAHLDTQDVRRDLRIIEAARA